MWKLKKLRDNFHLFLIFNVSLASIHLRKICVSLLNNKRAGSGLKAQCNK